MALNPARVTDPSDLKRIQRLLDLEVMGAGRVEPQEAIKIRQRRRRGAPGDTNEREAGGTGGAVEFCVEEQEGQEEQ